MNRSCASLVLSLASVLTSCSHAAAQDTDVEFTTRIEQAVERAVPLIETTSAETARQRKCFNCHGQAMPVFALVEAKEHGFDIDAKNLFAQLDHTYGHLERSKKKYENGSGTGGQVDTAGWALWALEAGDREVDDITDPVISYILSKQKDKGLWKCTSRRPPSESSNFATTYLALRGLESFGDQSRDEAIKTARERASNWFADAEPKETEDRVFQLLTLPYLETEDRTEELVGQLRSLQRPDGGWAQLSQMDSDAYATSTVLYALAQAGVDAVDPDYRRGLEYLLDRQLGDGSWHVTTRSDPFQEYFESGFPHGDDQFISTTATCWATVALLHALPAKASMAIVPQTD